MTDQSLSTAHRLASLLRFVLSLIPAVVGLVAYDVVSSDFVVHYTPSQGVYYGIETVSKEVGLFVVPLIAGVVFVGTRLLDRRIDRSTVSNTVQRSYDAGILLTLLVLVGIQLLLAGLNVQ